MPSNVGSDAALVLFREIQAEFSGLSMSFQREPDGDLILEIPAQPGLRFEIELNLQQGDELYLTAGELWVTWFPCEDRRVVEDYRNAIRGLISGAYRVVEHYRGRRPFRAELQRPEGDGWITVKEWRKVRLPLPFTTSTRILQNV